VAEQAYREAHHNTDGSSPERLYASKFDEYNENRIVPDRSARGEKDGAERFVMHFLTTTKKKAGGVVT
jgi:hypothetical protein